MRLASTIFAAGTALALTACGAAADNKAAPKSEAAGDAASDKTIAAGLGSDDGKFADAAKAAGLDVTLSGPGPYTVLVPTNAAFDKLPAGALDTLMKPTSRAKLTKMLANHILPGAILAADITKAIDNGKGKAMLATFGGGTLTAIKEGDAIIITDGAGTRAKVTGPDEQKSNGVIHRIDAVLMPS